MAATTENRGFFEYNPPMLFNSFQYVVFLPIVVALYWLVPRKARPLLLLVASYVFYSAWNPAYLLLILAMTIFNWVIGFVIAKTTATKKLWLIIAVIANVATLGYFKYSNFFLKMGYDVLDAMHMPHSSFLVHVILPLGISFFTFEFLHYVIEVYKGSPTVNNPVSFALFAGFFPTQIAGPIKRYVDFVPQIESPAPFNLEQFEKGFVMVLHGLAKKILLADNLAVFVNAVYSQPGNYGIIELWLATYAFAFQVYCDFSGYTDIAIGSSMMLGITVPPNFNVPYMSNNIRELWHRQHISLSLWFRDYVYFSLGGSRVSTVKMYRNLLLTTSLAGLWHGAAWHHVLWGLFQGGCLIVHRQWMLLYKKHKAFNDFIESKLWNAVAIFITFQAFAVSYVFFRADDVPTAFKMLERMFRLWKIPAEGHPMLFTSHSSLVVPLIPFLLIGLIAAHIFSEWARKREFWSKFPRWAQAAYCSFLIFMMISLMPDQSNRFLYFQF